jgi:hypothetical protein
VEELVVAWCRVLESEILGVSNFRPFEGESAEKRLWLGAWLWVSLGAADDRDVTELVDAFRRPAKERDSRFFRVDAVAGAEA